MLESIRELEHTLLSKTKAEQVGLPGLEKSRKSSPLGRSLFGRSWGLGVEVCLVSDLGLRKGADKFGRREISEPGENDRVIVLNW